MNQTRHFLWIGSLLLALWPTWVYYGQRLTDGSDEPFGVFALITGAIFLWRDRADLNFSVPRAISAVALLLVVTTTRGLIPNLISAILSFTILALALGNPLRNPGIWGLLLLSLPLIASLQFYLGYPMRLVAALSAETILSIFGQEIERTGTLLSWQGNRVGVDPACSGIEMLWLGLFLAASLCSFRRFSLATCIAVMSISFVGVIASNSLRVTLLFLKESGQMSLPEWTHEGIGILLFSLLVLLLDHLFGRTCTQKREPAPLKIPLTKIRFNCLTSMALLFGCFPLFLEAESSPQRGMIDFPGWPETWKGGYLERLPLTPEEKSFASNFPGEIATFTNGPDKLIFRWVTQPTRKLHSSADCLRAAGYEIEIERSGQFIATDPFGQYLVEETIYNDHSQWSEVSPWFWAATFHRTTGPWWAVTTIRPFGE